MAGNEHIIYSAEDIHRYFSGRMDASEMHAMEKASLNDPLLADAMEGYHSLPAIGNEKDFNAIQKQLDELKEKISGKTVSIKKYNDKWWKVAAAVLLLMGSVFAFYQLNKTNNNKGNNDIAKQDILSHAPQMKATADSNVADKQADSTALNKVDPAKEYPPVAMADVKQNKVSSDYERDRVQKEDLVASNNIAADSVGAITLNNVKPNEDKPALQYKSNDDYYANGQKDEKKELNGNVENRRMLSAKKETFLRKAAITFTGKITDANNNAIPYANLIINNQRQTRTDANGLFNLSLPDSVIRLDVAAQNYYPKTTNVSANNFAGIILTAKRNTLRKRQSLTDTFARSQVQVLYKTGVEPKEGWIKYQLFLIDRLSNSEYDDGRLVTGETIVRFEIGRDLQPTNFTFEKSINQDVNDAIETLILTGPEWRIAENGGIPGIVQLRIIF